MDSTSRSNCNCLSVCNGREPLNSGYPYSSQVRISVTRVNEGGASNLTKCTATAVTKFTLLTSAFCVENNSEGITIEISVYIGTKFPPRKTTEGKEWFIYTQVAMINMKAPLGLLNAQMATYGTWDEGNQPLWYPGFPGIICGWGEVLEDCCPAFRCSSFLRQTQCLDAKEYPSYLWWVWIHVLIWFDCDCQFFSQVYSSHVHQGQVWESISRKL